MATQENEVAHWEQVLESEIQGLDEAGMKMQAILKRLRPKIERARQDLEELRDTSRADWLVMLAEYQESRDDIRDTFKRLGAEADQGGPPLA